MTKTILLGRKRTCYVCHELFIPIEDEKKCLDCQKVRRLPRECVVCSEKFQPKGKFQTCCNDCLYKHRGGGNNMKKILKEGANKHGKNNKRSERSRRKKKDVDN